MCIRDSGKRMRVVRETLAGVYSMRISRALREVHSRMTGGCTMGTSAMYEYAATMIAPW